MEWWLNFSQQKAVLRNSSALTTWLVLGSLGYMCFRRQPRTGQMVTELLSQTNCFQMTIISLNNADDNKET